MTLFDVANYAKYGIIKIQNFSKNSIWLVWIERLMQANFIVKSNFGFDLAWACKLWKVYISW